MGTSAGDHPQLVDGGAEGEGTRGSVPPPSEHWPEPREAVLLREAHELKDRGDQARDRDEWWIAVQCYLDARARYEELAADSAVRALNRDLVNVMSGRAQETERARQEEGLSGRCRAHHQVLVVDDDHGWRQLISTQLRHDADGHFEVSEALDAFQAIGLAAEVKPEVILLDLRLPNMTGMEALPLIRDSAPDAKVIIVSVYQQQAFGKGAERAGAVQYLEKAPNKDFAHILREVCGCPA